jgi:gliding motility-associated-like protein
MNTGTVIVGINPTPTVSAGPDQTICAGNSVTLSGGGAVTYTWTGGVSNGAPFTPTTTASYTVTGTDGNGCKNSDVVNVNVNPLPNVNAGADQSTCLGNSVTLSGGGAVTYTWTGGISNGTPFTPTATATYTVTGTDANGCKNSDVVNVIVNPLPNVNAGADQSTCLGNSVTLSGSGAITYTWTGGISNGTPFTPTATASYTVTGTDANGCKNSDVVNVTVNPLPNVNAGANQSTCSGNSVTLSGSGAVTYTWTGGISNGTSFTPTVTANYTVTGTDANGCKNSDVVNVTVNPLPQVNTAGNAVMPCGASSFTLNGSTNAASPSYSWAGPGILSGGNTATPVINNSGVYTLTVTDANGCSNTSTVTVTSKTLSVSFTPDVTSGTSPLTVNFNNTSVNASSYSWTFGNGGTSSAMNPSTTYTAGGTYTVMLVGTGGNCIDTAYSIITVLDNSSVTVPNIFSPNGDGLNDLYFFVTTGIEDLHADLFNRWGELVGTIIGANGSWDGRTLKGENVSDGTYFYILKAKGYDGKTFDMHGFFTLMR